VTTRGIGILALFLVACASVGLPDRSDGSSFDDASAHGSDAASPNGDAGASNFDAGSPALPPPSVWVATNGDDTTCARLAPNKPCLTFNRAYQLASPGDVVDVAPGTYGDQVISYDATKPTNPHCNAYPGMVDLSGCITFEPAGGGAPRSAEVTIGALRPFGSFVRARNMTVGGVGVQWLGGLNGVLCKNPQPHDFVFEGLQFAPDTTFHDSSAYDVSLLDSDIGPNHDSPGTIQISAYNCAGVMPPSQLLPNHVYFDHVHIHDLLQTVKSNGPNCSNDPQQFFCNHMECIHWNAGNDGLITNSRFENCAQQDISLETNGGLTSNIDGFRAIGNTFDAPCSNQRTVAQGGTCGTIGTLLLIAHTPGDSVTNAHVLFNSINGQVSWQPDVAGNLFTGATEIGNLLNTAAQSYYCTTTSALGIQRGYNVRLSGGATCDPTEATVTAMPWVAPAAPSYDFHLQPGSPVENLVPVTSGPCPTFDMDGNPRPLNGPRCDAGAYER
jgi:hypothetical protein